MEYEDIKEVWIEKVIKPDLRTKQLSWQKDDETVDLLGIILRVNNELYRLTSTKENLLEISKIIQNHFNHNKLDNYLK